MNVKEFAEWLLETQDPNANVQVVMTKRRGLPYGQDTEDDLFYTRDFTKIHYSEDRPWNGKKYLELGNCAEI